MTNDTTPCLPKRSLSRPAITTLVLLWLVLMFLPGINHGLWRPDEHRVAGICAEMARTGDFITPRLNGKPFLEKPPLYFVVGALFGKVFGESNDVSYRLVSLLFTALTLTLTFLSARRHLKMQEAMVAVGILSSTLMFFRTSRWIQVDMALAFGVTLAMYAYLRWMEEPKARYSVLLGLGLAVSFMVKGLVGPALIGAAVLGDTIRLRKPENIWRMRPFLILTVIGVPLCVWIGALHHGGGWDHVREVIVVNNFMRFAGIGEGAALGHQHGIRKYLERFPGDFLPWTFLFIPALVHAVRNVRTNPFASWFIAPFILLCMSSTKRDVYLLPLYPAAACMIAEWLQNTQRDKWSRAAMTMTWVCAGALTATPLAGIWLGHPALGILAGSFGLLSFLVLSRRRELIGCTIPHDMRLVLAVCIGLCCASSLYFAYRTPRKDYLAFALDALDAANGEEITILCPDEIIDGILPMAAGKNFNEIASPDQIRTPGLYAWTDTRDRTLEALQRTAGVEIIVQRTLGSHKGAILARVKPRGGGNDESGANGLESHDTGEP
ncbi:MAG: glycosyltransferase family 39 protein [Victivallales bacterium]|nr:glycosyltransferase family 39 protein [Victivallales bacterium]